MDIFAKIEPFIAKFKPQLIKAAGSADGAITDEGLGKVAAELHKQLPFAVRAMVGPDVLRNLLISNRERVELLLCD